MSDITGEGYGDKHDWGYEGTERILYPVEFRSSLYICKKCGEYFRHHYCVTPDIFDAMKKSKVKELCQ